MDGKIRIGESAHIVYLEILKDDVLIGSVHEKNKNKIGI